MPASPDFGSKTNLRRLKPYLSLVVTRKMWHIARTRLGHFWISSPRANSGPTLSGSTVVFSFFSFFFFLSFLSSFLAEVALPSAFSGFKGRTPKNLRQTAGYQSLPNSKTSNVSCLRQGHDTLLALLLGAKGSCRDGSSKFSFPGRPQRI